MELFLIDAIAPFFRGVEGRRINWSKIPFSHLPLAPEQAPEREGRFAQIKQDMEVFCRRVVGLGYNAITLDDLAHLAESDLYEPEVQEQITICRGLFRDLFKIARHHGLDIYITMDVVSFTPKLRRHVGVDSDAIVPFLKKLITQFFENFPEVAGLIFRIGESDGQDVAPPFRSELVLRTAREVNAFLCSILPVFEKHDRHLILRTWTVGAHRVGDLIWHRDTFRKAFESIDSPKLILSMKYGESDFFRYLPLNSNFFRTNHLKIVELQTRREYEGCGEYPSFIGADYEQVARQLEGARNVIGISVWCQTGGWTPFRRLAFLPPDDTHTQAIWTEINTAVTLRIFKDRASVEEAVRKTVPKISRIAEATWPEILELLRLSEEAVKELLYIEEFARQKLFFRRVRIPPLLVVYWHNVFVNHSAKKILKHFVSDPEAALHQSEAALRKIDKMVLLAEQCDLPVDDIIYMRDTPSHGATTSSPTTRL